MIIFVLVKTDEVQLILVSAVILMPGACVFPTTTSGGSAAAVGRGRCSARLHKGNLKENQELNCYSEADGDLPGFFPRAVAVVEAVAGKVGSSNPRGQGAKCRWGCLSIRSFHPPATLLSPSKTLNPARRYNAWGLPAEVWTGNKCIFMRVKQSTT